MKKYQTASLCPQGAGLAATNTSRVPLLLICIKLTTVMGLTWILTLIANWQHAAFLQYPATVINSMQGASLITCSVETAWKVKFQGKIEKEWFGHEIYLFMPNSCNIRSDRLISQNS